MEFVHACDNNATGRYAHLGRMDSLQTVYPSTQINGEFIMSFKTVRAHFDGTYIRLDEPCQLEPDTLLLVTVLQGPPQNVEHEDWLRIAQSALETAYSSDEPTYSLDMIKEPNPDYEGR
jgi:hypothetical protein